MKNFRNNIDKNVQLVEDSISVKSKGLVMDPLRLSIRFYNKERDINDSTRWDDLMCEGI